MMELLWLLLPVAAASGWLAARRSDARAAAARRMPDAAYFKGLNYLLNEQPDKAIDVFTQLVEVDEETVETHLALGNLFRRRGEVDRAIRIHQNLIARDNLSDEQRALALLELGQDYMRSGLFDRAENLFQELAETRLYREQALHNLRQIFEQEKDWERCLESAGRWEQVTGEALRVERAHYYCELAQVALRAGDEGRAADLLEQASRCDPQGIRAVLLRAELAFRRGEIDSAIELLGSVEQKSPDFTGETLSLLRECYRAQDREAEFGTHLRELVARTHGEVEVLALSRIIQEEEGELPALQFVLAHLKEYPSLEGLQRLFALNLNGSREILPETVAVVEPMLGRLVAECPAYQCQRCGFSARELHWQCPGCKSWSSIRRIRSLSCNKHSF